jgi:hypothetical protein
MIFNWNKKYQLLLILMLISLVFTFILISRNLALERSQKSIEQKISNDLLHLREPNWNGYARLNKGFHGLLKNWDGGSSKKLAANSGLEANSFIETEFDRQISEIKRISEIEESLKLSRVNETYQDYAMKRRRFFDTEFQKKSLNLQETLQSDLAKKRSEAAQQLHDFENTIISEQQLDLVNLQLELAVSDLKEQREENLGYRKKIQAKITAIKLEIARKVAAKKELVNKQLSLYEQQRTEEIQQLLENLRLKLNSQLENDLSAFKANLNQNYDDWHQSQTGDFTKAINARQQEKKLK